MNNRGNRPRSGGETKPLQGVKTGLRSGGETGWR